MAKPAWTVPRAGAMPSDDGHCASENIDTMSLGGRSNVSGWSVMGPNGVPVLPYTTPYVVSIRSDGVPRVKFGTRSLNVLGRDPLPFSNTQPIKVRATRRPKESGWARV